MAHMIIKAWGKIAMPAALAKMVMESAVDFCLPSQTTWNRAPTNAKMADAISRYWPRCSGLGLIKEQFFEPAQ